MRSNTNVNYNPREPVLPGGYRYIMDHDPLQSQFPFENLRPLGFSPITRGPEFAWSNLYDKKKVFYKETEFLLF